MITLTREEAQHVLKVLEYPGPSWPESRTELAVVLRYKLSAPEPEPVAWAYRDVSSGNLFGFTSEYCDDEPAENLVLLYSAPPQQSKSEPVAKLFGTLPVYETSVSLKDAVKQEPVAWVENLTDAQPHCVIDLNYCSVAQHKRGDHLKYIPLYTDPTPCQTCEALARTVMMDQTSHDTTPPQRKEWIGLTEQEHANIAVEAGCASADWVFYGAAVERALKEKNT